MSQVDLVTDVVVVGAGPAGEVVAGRCADGGLSVVLVERELVGGECSYWGCIPSKTLIRPGDVLAAARRVPGAAEAVTGGVDVAAALAQRDYMTSGWSDSGQLAWLADRGIRLVRGHGRLAGERRVDVSAADGSVTRLRARRVVVLATGTSAVIPPVPGLRDVRPWDNRDVTSLKDLPRRLLVLGGGAVGLEMAQACRRLGVEQVTVIEGADRLLAREEPFAGAEIRAALAAEGVTVHTGTLLTSARREGGDGPVVAALSDGREVVADEILVAVGRRPSTGELGLPVVGLAAGRFVEVDDRFRAVGVPDGWLYAVGDCTGRALLTHMGKYHGRLAADVILGRNPAGHAGTGAVDAAGHGGSIPVHVAGREIVPRVTFTDPQVCAVGLTEAEARAAGIEVRVVQTATGGVPGAYTLGNGVAGTSQLLVDEARRTVVGATFTGPGVAELLHSATVAIVGQVPVDRLWHAVPAFPTISEVWLRLLEEYGL